MGTIAFLIILFTVFINISLGVFILGQNTKSKPNQIFFLMTLFISAWGISNYFTEEATSLTLNTVFNHLAFLFAFLVAYTGFLFSLSFPVWKQISKLSRVGIGLFGILFAFFSSTKLVVGEVYSESGNLVFTVGPYIGVYIVAILALLVGIIYNLAQVASVPNTKESSQAKLVLFGFSSSLVIGVLTNLVAPTIAGTWSFAKFGPITTVFLVVSIAYAIAKYGLFDIRPTVARLTGYMLSLSIIILSFVGIVFIASSLLFKESVPIEQEVFFASLTIVIALSYQYIKKYFDKLTNQFFYQDAYDPQLVLNELNAFLVNSSNVENLLSNAKNIITKHLKPIFVEIIALGEEDKAGRISDNAQIIRKKLGEDLYYFIKQSSQKTFYDEKMENKNNIFRILLKKNQIAVITKLTTKEGQVGLIVLGEHKSGSRYNQRDIQLLETAADSIAISVQNALRYEEIKEFNINLQKKIETATHDLQKTNEKLKELDEAKDEFISMASHQLRTPLTSVKGYVSMVLEGEAGKINDQQKKFLNQAFISSQRMVYLISDLLNVSRLKTGKFIIENGPSYLPDVVEEEIEQLRETAKSRGLEIIFNRPASFPTVSIDEEKIRQVIMNFADNAVYYTPPGGQIKVELTAAKSAIEYRVRDNGIGVPKSEQHHLFNKFYRAGNARKARPDGTGLGLFMAKKVIIAQGGSIIFDSKEGKGSTFGFSLPRAKVEKQ